MLASDDADTPVSTGAAPGGAGVEGFSVPHPKITTRFGCHTHFKILLQVSHPNTNIFSSNIKVKSKSFPRLMAHRAAPISVSIALGHASANAVRATAGGWSTGSSACLTSPLLSHFSSARRERQRVPFLKSLV